MARLGERFSPQAACAPLSELRARRPAPWHEHRGRGGGEPQVAWMC